MLRIFILVFGFVISIFSVANAQNYDNNVRVFTIEDDKFSKSASFEYPPFRNSHLPTRRVVLLSVLYSLIPTLSIGLIEFLPKKFLRVILLRKMQKDCILVLHFTQNLCILFPAPKLQSGCNLGN